MSRDMVVSYVETLIEELTGVGKAAPDHDGDYPVRYRDALYYVRVDGDHVPVVQVFSVAVAEIELSSALAKHLNDINAQLRFCRTFWVRGQVLFEAEHLGMSIDEADFRACTENVAEATDFFAPGIASRHGGSLVFADSKGSDSADAPSPGTGFYL